MTEKFNILLPGPLRLETITVGSRATRFLPFANMDGGNGAFLTVEPIKDKEPVAGKTNAGNVMADKTRKNARAGLLVVEDEEVVRELIRITLGRAISTLPIPLNPQAIFYAKDGTEAREIFEARKQEIDFVITDMNYFPGGPNGELGGAEFSKFVREHDTDVPTRIVATSAGNAPEAKALVADGTALAFWEKNPLMFIKMFPARVKALLDEYQPPASP